MIGWRFGDYEIESRIAAGGMGEVWKARDGKLGRAVALKLLAERLAADREFTRRFALEARSAAGLDHPAIATVYAAGEVEGRPWLAMEFIEGETLAESLMRGRIPAGRALEWVAQLADGLAAAHAKGVIHRDIKPANLIIQPDGKLKILDFGLAKPEADSAGISPEGSDPQAATRDLLTAAGVVVGTAAYMSPEQARGEPLDRRSDIFSAGVILHELLAGKHPFRGKSTADTLAALLHLHPAAPPIDDAATDAGEVARILHKAMAKERESRYQHADEMAVDLRAARHALGDRSAAGLSGAVTAQNSRVAAPRATGRARVRRVFALLAALAALLAPGWFAFRPGGFGRGLWETRALPLGTPAITLVTRDASVKDSAAISPDGQLVVFAAARGGSHRLWARSLAGTREVALTPGPDDDTTPIFTPDGALILFQRERADTEVREIRAVTPLGGESRKLAEGARLEGIWPDGKSLLGLRCPGGLVSVALDGGAESTAVPLPDADCAAVAGAGVAPSGAVLYLRRGEASGTGGLYEAAAGGPPKRLAAAEITFDGAVSTGAGGRLIYFSASNPGASFGNIVRYDRRSGALDALTGGAGICQYPRLDASGRRLVFVFWNEANFIGLLRPGAGASGAAGDGGLQRITEGPLDDEQPVFSPDGKLAAFVSDLDGNYNLWLADLERGERRQLTFNADHNYAPRFSADGRHIFHLGNRGGKAGLYRVPVGGGPSELVAENLAVDDYVTRSTTPALSPDGATLATGARVAGGGYGLLLIDAASGKAAFAGSAAGRAAAFSPDGKSLYAISRRGSIAEPFTRRGPNRVWRYGLDGSAATLHEFRMTVIDRYLKLSADGRRLYFFAEIPNGGHNWQLWRLDLASGREEPVTAITDAPPRFGFDVSADERSFILNLNRVESNVVLLDGLPADGSAR